MKNYRHIIKSKSRYLISGGYFLLAAIVLQFILPGEPHFKYEYQKGSPWKHNNLVAPFNFAILKSEKELDAEKTELLKTFAPYFRADSAIAATQKEKFNRDLNKSLEGSIRKAVVINELTGLVDSIYKKGILQKSPESYEELKGRTEISRIEGVHVIKIPVSKLFTERTAYNSLSTNIEKIKKNFPPLSAQFGSIDPSVYISSNLRYDKDTNEKEIERLTGTLSVSRGMVQTGERIILQGEIIDDHAFQILESLRVSFEKNLGDGINRLVIRLGKFLLITVFLTLLYIFLYFHRTDILNETRKLAFLLIFIVSMVSIAMIIQKYEGLNIYLLPMAILPIVIRIFFNSRTAIFSLITTCLLIGFFAPNNYEFVALQVAAGIIGVFSLTRMHRRVHLVMAAIWVFITYIIVFSAINLVQEGRLMSYSYDTLKWFFFSSLMILLVYPLIYVFEKIFGFVSDVTLIELSDTNQPLLRNLSEQAPGTFQHSIQVANLAEEIILQIGGNPFLVRAGALYHDIGKIVQPSFFIENQLMGMNPHDKMDNLKSAGVIIDHVKNGVNMAYKQKLPASIIEFVATHHGTTKAKYFYLKQQQENPGTEIDIQQYAYPGPLPKSKEAAVVMIVDGIEAASRSLKDKTIENLRLLINEMVDQKMKEHQLDESELTFRDINKIKEVLLNKLMNIYHIRIEYPKEKNNN